MQKFKKKVFVIKTWLCKGKKVQLSFEFKERCTIITAWKVADSLCFFFRGGRGGPFNLGLDCLIFEVNIHLGNAVCFMLD